LIVGGLDDWAAFTHLFPRAKAIDRDEVIIVILIR